MCADPLDVAGVVPDMPIAIFGWGAIPDQHGRRFAGDDGPLMTSARVPTAWMMPIAVSGSSRTAQRGVA